MPLDILISFLLIKLNKNKIRRLFFDPIMESAVIRPESEAGLSIEQAEGIRFRMGAFYPLLCWR